MSFGGPNSQGILRQPPLNGSFPLDHEGVCKKIVEDYLKCLYTHQQMQTPCRDLAKQYFECRMVHGLMKREEWKFLGFDDQVASEMVGVTSLTKESAVERCLGIESMSKTSEDLLLLPNATVPTSMTSIDVIKLGIFDQHHKVRKKAIKALQSCKLGKDQVLDLVAQLRLVLGNDPDAQVRHEAIHSIYALASRNPDLIADNQERLIDLVFVDFCDCVNDLDYYNRAKACECLGMLTNIKPSFLLQTLSKDATKDDENLPIPIPWSACGAFIHGLEDEFELVRSASIRSIFTQSLLSKRFAAKVTDYIIDAFNDESEAVRILAVRALHGICLVHRVQLKLEHLESTLCLLEDRTDELRDAVCALLQVAYIENEEGLQRTIKSLISCATKNIDLANIMLTLARLGANNSELVERIVNDMLIKIEKYFLIVEPRIEDVSHSAKLVVALNALAVRPELDRWLPSYVYKQALYLQLRYPHSMPDFQSHSKLWPLFYKQKKFAIPTATTAASDLPAIYQRFNAVITLKQPKETIQLAMETMQRNLKAKMATCSKQTKSHYKLLVELLELIISLCNWPDKFAVRKRKILLRFCPTHPALELFINRIERVSSIDTNSIILDYAEIVNTELTFIKAEQLACHCKDGKNLDKPIKALSTFPLSIPVSAKVGSNLQTMNNLLSLRHFCFGLILKTTNGICCFVVPSTSAIDTSLSIITCTASIRIRQAETIVPITAKLVIGISPSIIHDEEKDLEGHLIAEEAGLESFITPICKPLELFIHFKSPF